MKKVFFAMIVISLFISSCAPLMSASAKEPQKKEAAKTEKKEADSNASTNANKQEVQDAEKRRK